MREAGAESEDRRPCECTASPGRIEAGTLAVAGGGYWPLLSEGRGGSAGGLALGPQERMLFRLPKTAGAKAR